MHTTHSIEEMMIKGFHVLQDFVCRTVSDTVVLVLGGRDACWHTLDSSTGKWQSILIAVLYTRLDVKYVRCKNRRGEMDRRHLIINEYQ